MVITVSDVTVAEADFARVAAEQWLRKPRSRWPLWLYGLSAAVLLGLAGLRLRDRLYDPTAPWPTIELVWTAVVLFYAFWWRRHRLQQHYRKAYRSSPSHQAPTTYVFQEDGVENHSELARGVVRYAVFTKAVVRGPWLLLYFSDNGFAFIDLRQVQAPATAEQLLQLLRAKGVRVE